MYYAWASWWWLSSVIPMVIIVWMLFGWSDRRSRRVRVEGDRRRDEWDDHTAIRHFGPYRGRGPRNYRRADTRIAEDVNDRLMLHGEIDPTDIEVSVADGTVQLSGMVESRFEKRLAERIADSVAGVVDVDNRLRIGSIDHSGDVPAAQPGLPH
ncbi:MAG TPA: BON domain-containing protein [Polyangiales bacterium]